jgi:hypothetical protein
MHTTHQHSSAQQMHSEGTDSSNSFVAAPMSLISYDGNNVRNVPAVSMKSWIKSCINNQGNKQSKHLQIQAQSLPKLLGLYHIARKSAQETDSLALGTYLFNQSFLHISSSI